MIENQPKYLEQDNQRKKNYKRENRCNPQR